MTHSIPDHRVHQVKMQGGDVLHVRDFGPVDAPAVFYHHGTPSCGVAIPGGWTGIPDAVRLISFDRPGYGQSSNLPGRRVSDAAEWCANIADHLDITQFSVMGTSGGGPHAAATAAGLPDRVTKLCISVGLGPVGEYGFDVRAKMLTDTVLEIDRAREGEESLRSFIADLLDKDDPLGDWMNKLPASDVEILSRPEVKVEEDLEAAQLSATGYEGWIEDDLAFFARGWNVDFTQITAQTLLLYGAADVLVPAAHGDVYRRAIGHGHLLKLPGRGHWMRDEEPSVLKWLAAPPGSSFEPAPTVAQTTQPVEQSPRPSHGCISPI